MKRFTRTVCVFLAALLICQLLPMVPVKKVSSVVKADATGDDVPGDMIAIDDVNFPDNTFRSYLKKNYDIDRDGYFSDGEIALVTSIRASSIWSQNDTRNIQGIEFFTELDYLDCMSCGLQNIDVSCYPKLKTLYIGNNELASIDLSSNPNLEVLVCNSNNITSLSLINNSKLKYINCCYNPLSELDISNCLDIEVLFIAPQGVRAIHTDTSHPYVYFVPMDSFTLRYSNRSAISVLRQRPYSFQNYSYSDENGFIRNDSIAIQSVQMNGKKLELRFDSVRTSFSPIDPTPTSTATPTPPPPTSTPTPIPGVYIDILNFPDKEFRNYIASNFDDGDLFLSDSELNSVKVLRIPNNTKSLVGIEYFTRLQYLYTSNRKLTELDISHNTELLFVDCSHNQLTHLDVSKNTKLLNLKCSDNNLSTLILGKNNKIEYLDCTENLLNELSLGTNAGLQSIYVDGNRYRRSDGTLVYYDNDSSFELYIDEYVNVKMNAVVSATPTPTGKPTSIPKPTVAPTVKPTPTTAPVEESGVAGFVERLYSVALGRPSDPYGKADWVNRVRTEGYTGADLARGFLFSDEFLSKSMSNSEFLDVLYATFFNRPADEGGKNNWLALMDQGWGKKDVIDGFINSIEWANLCLTYGIASGTTAQPNITIEPNDNIIGFATRLYTTCLGREADPGGLMDWATQLANMKISGSDAAHGFFFSQEFLNADIDDAEYVKRLYRTFMGREYDQGGFDNWMNALASGQTREDVFQGFAGSAEWAGICAVYGILK